MRPVCIAMARVPQKKSDSIPPSADKPEGSQSRIQNLPVRSERLSSVYHTAQDYCLENPETLEANSLRQVRPTSFARPSSHPG